jgi:ADP-ribose pyrophosphatase YjhB (NUDIX family)
MNVVLFTGRLFYFEGEGLMEQQNYITYLRSMVGNKKIILNAACAVISDDSGKILLQRRSDNKKWGLPGGLMELDESIEQTAIREVKEETNLDIILTDFIGVFNNPNMRWREADEARVICFSFVGKVVGGTLCINDTESLGFDYFGPGELPEIHSVDNRQTIQAFFDQKHHLVEGREYK